MRNLQKLTAILHDYRIFFVPLQKDTERHPSEPDGGT